MNHSSFIDLVCGDDRGQAWCVNMLLALESTRDWKEPLRIVLSQAITILEAGASKGLSIDPCRAFKALVSACSDTDVSNWAHVRSRAKTTEVLTHVTDVDSMRDHHFHMERDLAETFIDSGNLDHGSRQEWVRATVLKSSLEPRTGRLALRRLWLAPNESGSSVDGRSAASVARDERGLIHFTAKDSLVVYYIGGGTPIDCHRPCVIDGTGRRFCAKADAGPSTDGWGSTIDLKRFADGNRVTDGLPEAIVEPPESSDQRLQAIVAIGAPGREAPPVGVAQRGLAETDDDKAFLELMHRKWGKSGPVAATLTEYLKEL